MRRWIVGTLLLAGVISNNAVAQFFPPIQQKTAITGIGLYKELDFPKSYLITVDHAREFRIRTWFSFGGEANFYRFTSGDYSAVGLGIRPVTRLFFYSGQKLQVFGESKGGIIFMLPQTPGKLINYTFVATLGADWYLSKSIALRIAGGYSHFSNGKRKGDVQNPTWDGLGISVSILGTLR